MPKLGLRLQSTIGTGGGVDPLNWFRTSLHSDDFDTTLVAAKNSAYKDDYVLVVDTASLSIPSYVRELFDGDSSEATAAIIIADSGSVSSFGGSLIVKGPTDGNRTVQFNLPSITVPVVELQLNGSSQVIKDLHIEGIGNTQQNITDIETRNAWELEDLHLVNLNVANVYADGSTGDGAAGDSGTSYGIIYGNSGADGTDGTFSSSAYNGGNGDSISTSQHGGNGNSGNSGGHRAVENIYLNGCTIYQLYARNANGGGGGNGGDGESAHGGNGGAGGDSRSDGDYPTPGDGGAGGDGTANSNGGNGGSGGNADQTTCTTFGQGAPSTVTFYHKTAYGGGPGSGGYKGTGYGGNGGVGGIAYDAELNQTAYGSAGSNGTGSSTGSNGSAGSAGSNFVRVLHDPNNKITFITQF
jgi:hypothetical protein